MKHTKKYMLVDYNLAIQKNIGDVDQKNIFESIHTDDKLKPSLNHSVSDQHIQDLDVVMKDVLQNKSLTGYEKVKMYNELLQKYTFAKNENKILKNNETENLLDQISKRVLQKTTLKNKKNDGDVKKRHLSESLNASNPFLTKLTTSRNKKKILESFIDDFSTPIASRKTKPVKIKTRPDDLENSDEIIYDPDGKKIFLKRKLQFHEYSPEDESSIYDDADTANTLDDDDDDEAHSIHNPFTTRQSSSKQTGGGSRKFSQPQAKIQRWTSRR